MTGERPPMPQLIPLFWGTLFNTVKYFKPKRHNLLSYFLKEGILQQADDSKNVIWFNNPKKALKKGNAIQKTFAAWRPLYKKAEYLFNSLSKTKYRRLFNNPLVGQWNWIRFPGLLS
jgi:hypothetical protein